MPTKQKIQSDSLLELTFLSAPAFSPDGEHIAFIVSRPDEKGNRYGADLYLADGGGERVRPLTAGGDVKVWCWADSGTLLFQAVRGERYKKLAEDDPDFAVFYEIPIAGGEAREAFCLPVRVTGIRRLDDDLFLLTTFCHAGRQDFYALAPEDRQEQARAFRDECCYVFEDQPFWMDNRGVTSGRRTGLCLYRRSTGELTWVTEPFFNVVYADTDGQRVLFSGEAYTDARLRFHGLYLYDIGTAGTRCLIEPGKREIGVPALWGEQIFLAAKPTDVHPDSRMYCDLYLLDPGTGEERLLTRYEHYLAMGSLNSDARLGGGRTLTVDGDRLYFTATVGTRTDLYALDKTGRISEPLTPAGSCDGFDRFGEHTVWVGMYGGGLTELYLDGRAVTGFNARYLETHSRSLPEPLVYHGEADIDGWVMKPTDYVPGQKAPVIFHIHGGPCTAFSDLYHHEMQLWANNGYFVVFCNPRGSDGKGEDFANIRGKYGTIDYEDLMGFLDEALARYPDADAHRVGVTGGSYGGFMTNWIVGHTDRFVCAASQRSISNWVTMEHTSDIGAYFAPREMAASTETDVEKMWFHSPLKYAPQVKTPTLFIQSDADYRCWMADALSFYTALKVRGVESRMCLFKGESHELSRSGRPKSRIRRMDEILGWMDRHLKA